MNFARIFIWILIISMVTACKEDQPEPCNDCEKNQIPVDTIFNDLQFLDYVIQPAGSWWKYKRIDTTAHIYDSVFVEENYRSIVFDWTRNENALEVIYYQLKHSLPSPLSEGNLIERRTIENPNHVISTWYYHFFHFPFTVGDNVVSPIFTLRIEEIPSKTVLAGTFKKVIQIHSEDLNYILFLAPKVGIIKAEFGTKEIWELSNFYISI